MHGFDEIRSVKESLNREICRLRIIRYIAIAVLIFVFVFIGFVPKDVYVKIQTTSIRLGSMNPSIFSKISRLPSLLPQVKMINKKVKYIDLRWDSNYIKLDE